MIDKRRLGLRPGGRVDGPLWTVAGPSTDSGATRRRRRGASTLVRVSVADLARFQHSVAHVRQLERLGVPLRTTRDRVRRGLWADVLPGVVALHPGTLATEARRVAVRLWLPRGVLCGRTAAGVHGIAPDPGDRVEVAVTSGHPRGAEWVRVRRLDRLPPSHVVDVGPLVVTSIARTLVDVHDVTRGHAARRALVTGTIQRRLVGPYDVIAAAVTTPALRHRNDIAATLLYVIDGAQSLAEVGFVEFCAAWRLPAPTSQVAVATRLGTVHLDHAFVAERVGVEIDGFDGHAFDAQRRRDHERDMALAAAGWVVVRLEPRRLAVSPELVHADLSRLLAARRAA